MKFVIVTGMSGAGKSTVLKMLEDIGFFCVDNLPIPLVDKFMALAAEPAGEYDRVALGLDVRSIRDQQDIESLLDLVEQKNYNAKILFLDAQDDTLVRRYKETRRSHPLARGARVEEGIEKERLLLVSLRQSADYILDTSQLLTRELRQEIEKIFVGSKEYQNLFITVLSFGFKYGIPADADLVFDVRFLPNPYYDESLRQLTGNDELVQSYVMRGETAKEFEQRWFALLDFLLPHYVEEGKTQLVIAVGCTGGKHRSVTMANHLYAHLCKREDYGTRIEHRDILR